MRGPVQTDPVGYEDDLNLYQYVSNDPLNRSDPSGRRDVGTSWAERMEERRQAAIQRTPATQGAAGPRPAGAASANTSAPPAAQVANAIGIARRVSTLGVAAAQARSGMSPAAIRQTAGSMGRLGGAVAVTAEGIRVADEVQQGEPVANAVAAGGGRLATTATLAATGAAAGAQIGTVAPPYGIGGIIGGIAGAAGADLSGASEAVGEFARDLPDRFGPAMQNLYEEHALIPPF